MTPDETSARSPAHLPAPIQPPPLPPPPSVSVAPQVLPVDVLDILAVALVFCWQALWLFVLPGAAAGFITARVLTGLLGSPFLASLSILVGVAVASAVYLFFLMFTVWCLTISNKGITFYRLLGQPKFLPWESIKSIALASRRDLIVHGWIWPLLPAREMSPSLTCRGHYKISWVGGYCYFPPADAKDFEALVAARLKNNHPR